MYGTHIIKYQRQWLHVKWKGMGRARKNVSSTLRESLCLLLSSLLLLLLFGSAVLSSTILLFFVRGQSYVNSLSFSHKSKTFGSFLINSLCVVVAFFYI